MGWKTEILKKREKEAKAKQKELDKVKKDLPKRCYDCKNAYLMQSAPYNPIVSECKINKERNVAKRFNCNIGQFDGISGDTREIHPMISLD